MLCWIRARVFSILQDRAPKWNDPGFTPVELRSESASWVLANIHYSRFDDEGEDEDEHVDWDKTNNCKQNSTLL